MQESAVIDFARLVAAIGILLITGVDSHADREPNVLQSVFTGVSESDCRSIERLETTTGFYDAVNAASIQRCPAPQDYALFIVDDGDRTWYVVGSAGENFSLEDDIVYGEHSGNFPQVGIRGKFEWLVDSRDTVAGLIFRVSSSRSSEGQTGDISNLFSYQLLDGRPKFVGVSLDNQKARELIVQ